jgi:phosphoribulokinase
MSIQKQQVRVDLKFVEVDAYGRVIISNEKLSKAIEKAKESGVEYVFLEAETGDFCVAKSQPCA